MPYNNTPITPSKEITGTVSLPLARVKKIIATDDDISNCSNNAAFMITVATEMFLQHLVEQSYNIVKSEKKPRRNIQYRDVANAISRVENLEFLTDVVPKMTTYKQAKQKAREAAAATAGPSEATAQTSEAAVRAATEQARQPRIEEAMQPRPMLPEQMLSPPLASAATLAGPAGSPQVVIERQATNGAMQDPTDDAMEVDGQAGRVDTAETETRTPAADVTMVGSP